jgi:hypothetical protein
MTLTLDGKTYKTCCIIDRGPAPEVEQKATTQRNASATSLISSPSTNSIRSRSPSSEHFIAILGKGGSVPATDRVMIPTLGKPEELENLAKNTFGSYHVLNTLFIDKEDKMSAAELATTLEVVHNIAPNYTLRKHQCYWFALLIYLVVRSQTGGRESNGELYVKRGKLLGLTPEHSAGDDEMVAEEEYTKAWTQFTVSYSLFTACAGADNGNPTERRSR